MTLLSDETRLSWILPIFSTLSQLTVCSLVHECILSAACCFTGSLMEGGCHVNQAGNPLSVSSISVQESMRGKAPKKEAHQFSHLLLKSVTSHLIKKPRWNHVLNTYIIAFWKFTAARHLSNVEATPGWVFNQQSSNYLGCLCFVNENLLSLTKN